MTKTKANTKETREAQDLAARVKQLRIDNHMTQAQVAEKMNVTPGYISNVENNRTAMSLRMLTYYARLTGTTLDALVGDLVPEYKETALDHELMNAIHALPEDAKRKMLEIIKILAP